MPQDPDDHRPADRSVDEDTMTTLPHPPALDQPAPITASPRGRRAMGRPVLFTAMLGLASLMVLALLVVGPGLQIGIAMAVAGAAAALVLLAWVLAGPRL
ncbi:hypothetical protein [Brachybacterium squillarum]|uniref:hypothetical protein n=1 Tax=Brachybacterium squillarum TaxID=661979 RepID=UPI00222281F7|nr:hypothetical protein [Brachybacterium squillarum]MCW1804917.1 hypothetical protein [Brachybacterium squillarum]